MTALQKLKLAASVIAFGTPTAVAGSVEYESHPATGVLCGILLAGAASVVALVSAAESGAELGRQQAWRASRRWPAGHRPAPGEGDRRPSLTGEQWEATDAAYRNLRIADTLARHDQARTGGMENTAVMLLSDIAELYDERQPFMVDALAAYKVAPERMAGAAAVAAVSAMPPGLYVAQPDSLTGVATLDWFGEAADRQARRAAA